MAILADELYDWLDDSEAKIERDVNRALEELANAAAAGEPGRPGLSEVLAAMATDHQKARAVALREAVRGAAR